MTPQIITRAQVLAAPFRYPRHVTPAMEAEIGIAMFNGMIETRNRSADLPKNRNSHPTSNPVTIKRTTAQDRVTARYKRLYDKLPSGPFCRKQAAECFITSHRQGRHYIDRMVREGLVRELGKIGQTIMYCRVDD